MKITKAHGLKVPLLQVAGGNVIEYQDVFYLVLAEGFSRKDYLAYRPVIELSNGVLQTQRLTQGTEVTLHEAELVIK